MTSKEALARAKAAALQVLTNEDGIDPALAVIVLRDGGPVILPYYNDENARIAQYALVETIKTVKRAGQLDFAVLISEAWMSTAPRDADGPVPRPSEDPNRREVVIAHAVFDNGGTTTAIWPIIRDSAGKATALGDSTMPEDAEAESWLNAAVKEPPKSGEHKLMMTPPQGRA